MSDLSITVSGKKRLLTQGKFCDKNIVVTAESSNDAFWDIYQQNGERKNHSYAFAGQGWNDSTFKPKYNISPVAAGHMFSETGITDLVKILNDAGLSLDISNWNVDLYLAQNSDFLQTLPTLDCRKATSLNYFLMGCKALHCVEKVILKEDGSQAFSNFTFNNLPALTEIRFEGCIGKSLTISASPLLSTASVQTIVDCLKDLTGETAQTLTLHATVGANMTDAQKATITAKNWTLVY